MPTTFYRLEVNEIVFEITDEHVRSDLWDFAGTAVRLADVTAVHVRRERHPLTTLVVPVLAVLLASLFAVMLVAEPSPAELSGLEFGLMMGVATILLAGGIHGVLRYARNRSNFLSIHTVRGEQGLLFFSRDDATFRAFARAFVAALEGCAGASALITGGEWL